LPLREKSVNTIFYFVRIEFGTKNAKRICELIDDDRMSIYRNEIYAFESHREHVDFRSLVRFDHQHCDDAVVAYGWKRAVDCDFHYRIRGDRLKSYRTHQ
jgi:hypothetical protein